MKKLSLNPESKNLLGNKIENNRLLVAIREFGLS